MKRTIVTLLTCLLLITYTAACGATGNTGQSSTAADGSAGNESKNSESSTAVADTAGENGDSKPSGKITVGGWVVDDFESCLDDFHAVYPDIEVEIVKNDNTVHHQQLQTALAAGTGAHDVEMVEGNYIAQYRDTNALANLFDEPYNAKELEADFVESKWALALSADKTKLTAIPWDIGPASMFYRTDIFEEVGLPTDPDELAELMATWDGVLEVAEKVSIPGQRWFCANAVYLYTNLFANRDFYDESLNLKLERNGDLDCLTAVSKIRQNGWDMNVNMWTPEAYAALGNGAVVSVFSGSWYGATLKTEAAVNLSGKWGVTKLPGGAKSANLGGSYLAIPEQSKNKEAAWAFVKFMMATEKMQNKLFVENDLYPAYKPAWNDTTIYDIPDPYFTNQTPRKLWAQIAGDLVAVYTTMMDPTAENMLYDSVNASLEKGLEPSAIREQLSKDIAAATTEIKAQQIQILKDAGVWKE